MTKADHAIRFTYLSQEDLLEAGCLDFRMAIGAAESALLAHRNRDKIVQISTTPTWPSTSAGEGGVLPRGRRPGRIGTARQPPGGREGG